MFKFFSRRKAIPASKEERLSLVRRLMKLRQESDPLVGLTFTMMGTSIEDFNDILLFGSAEASIVTIVEQYTLGKEQGVTDDVVLFYMNKSHAQLLSMMGQNLPAFPPPHTLERYVEHYLGHIHGGGMQPVDRRFIPVGIREVRAFYGR